MEEKGDRRRTYNVWICGCGWDCERVKLEKWWWKTIKQSLNDEMLWGDIFLMTDKFWMKYRTHTHTEDSHRFDTKQKDLSYSNISINFFKRILRQKIISMIKPRAKLMTSWENLLFSMNREIRWVCANVADCGVSDENLMDFGDFLNNPRKSSITLAIELFVQCRSVLWFNSIQFMT